MSWGHNVIRAQSIHHLLTKLLLDIRISSQAIQYPGECVGCLED